MLIKVISVLILFVAPLFADDIIEIISPVTITDNTVISSPGALKRNCLTDLDVSVSSRAVVRILDGATTTYAIDISTTSAPSSLSVAPLTRAWGKDDPFCTGYNASMTINVHDTGGDTAVFKGNYRGQIRGVIR